MQELEEQNGQQATTLATLQSTKANTDTVPSTADIRSTVDDMVAPTASNALKSALAQKVGAG